MVIDLNSIDISEYRLSHFVKRLVQLCFPRIMRYLCVTFSHGVNGHKLDPPTNGQITVKRDEI